MGIAISLQKYLNGRAVAYEVMAHHRTNTSLATAHASSIPEDNLAKGVLIRRKDGYLLAIVPASCNVQLDEVGRWLKQPVGLATEEEVATIFGDCESGCVPPVAGAYGLTAVMDDRLEGFNDIYFEGGDHRTLVHMTGAEFHRLMATCRMPWLVIAVRRRADQSAAPRLVGGAQPSDCLGEQNCSSSGRTP